KLATSSGSRDDVRVQVLPSMWSVLFGAFAALASTACHSNEMHLINRLDLAASVEVRAPKLGLTGGCKVDFRSRFCVEEFEVIGVVDVSGRTDHKVAISDQIDDDHCTNVLWLRILRYGGVGPIDDPGTLV